MTRAFCKIKGGVVSKESDQCMYTYIDHVHSLYNEEWGWSPINSEDQKRLMHSYN